MSVTINIAIDDPPLLICIFHVLMWIENKTITVCLSVCVYVCGIVQQKEGHEFSEQNKLEFGKLSKISL